MSDIYHKVRNGTRSDATDLCRSCTRAVIIKGGAEGNEKRYCSALSYGTPLELTHLVAECSEYYNKNLPSLAAFEKGAWILTTSKARTLGFVTAQEWREKHRDEEMLPE